MQNFTLQDISIHHNVQFQWKPYLQNMPERKSEQLAAYLDLFLLQHFQVHLGKDNNNYYYFN
jgi:hypothetical protein